MTAVSLTLFAISLVAAGDEVPGTPLQVSVVAVQAKNEGRASKYFGPGLERVRRAVSGLDYDSFYKVRSADIPVPYGEEAKIYAPLSASNGLVYIHSQEGVLYEVDVQTRVARQLYPIE